MSNKVNNFISELTDKVNGSNVFSMIGNNRYTLNIDGLPAEVSILQVEGIEQLNQPWHYTITFTSSNKHLLVESFLNQNARLSFNSANPNNLSNIATKGLDALNSLTSANPLQALKQSESLI